MTCWKVTVLQGDPGHRSLPVIQKAPGKLEGWPARNLGKLKAQPGAGRPVAASLRRGWVPVGKKESMSQECAFAVLKADHTLSKSIAAEYGEGTVALCSAAREASSGIAVWGLPPRNKGNIDTLEKV